MLSRKLYIPISVCALLVTVWLMRPERGGPAVMEETIRERPEPAAEESAESGDAFVSESPVEEAVPVPVSTARVEPEPVDAQEPEQEPALSVEEATEPLMPLIPDWLLESGDVRRERVQVAGQWVDRARSRYAWSNGSLVEVEVTDLGSNASVELFKALGFDFDLEASTENGDLRLVIDGEDYVSNLEYDEADGSGYVQYVVAGRFLMEVQLENLPLESFQTLEDRDRLFETLLHYAAE